MKTQIAVRIEREQRRLAHEEMVDIVCMKGLDAENARIAAAKWQTKLEVVTAETRCRSSMR